MDVVEENTCLGQSNVVYHAPLQLISERLKLRWKERLKQDRNVREIHPMCASERERERERERGGGVLQSD